jgi:mono/diheme cytochrome c family protein
MKIARIASAGLLAALASLTPALATETSTAQTPTFSDEVSRIFQRHCQTCHRDGGIAPFALTSYEPAYKARDDIRDAVRARQMPPWKPVEGFGEFQHVRRLSQAEIATIDRWVAAGAPEGDRRRLPPPIAFPDTWTIGEPDVVLSLGAPYTVPARAGDLYRCFVVPTSFPEDRYVSAVEFLPGNRKIVHHVLTYIDTSEASVALDRGEDGPGYTCFGGPGFAPRGGLGGWAPGAPALLMPTRVGLLLPAGARVVIQVHYNNHADSAGTDLTRMALRFAREPVDKRVRSIPILNRTFTIPAGERRHEVAASWTIPSGWALHALAVSPHMHLLGREMKVTATYPDGTVRPLIYIDDWDFHWQGAYTFTSPVPLPGGTRIDMQAVYDNSEGNRRQPNRPPKPVSWGEGTTDEMAIVFLRVVVDSEQLDWRPPAADR